MRGLTWERSHSSAQTATRASQYQVTWKPMRGSTLERFHSSAQSEELLTIKLLRNTKEKPFKCTKCDKYFSRSSSMKGPTQIKPFNCLKCDKTFSIAGHLKEHEITHMGEKPFKCTNCDKSFSTSSYLKTHERIHSWEIPFKCTKRDKCFQYQVPWWSKCDKSFCKSDHKRKIRGPIQERSN